MVTIPLPFPGFTSQQGEIVGPRRTRLAEDSPAIGAWLAEGLLPPSAVGPYFWYLPPSWLVPPLPAQPP